MAYNQESIARIKGLKQLAEQLQKDYATKKELKTLSDRVDSLADDGALDERYWEKTELGKQMYQAPAAAQFITKGNLAAVETGSVTEHTLGRLLGDALSDDFAVKDAGGEFVLSGDGKKQYDFLFNDVKIGTYTADSTLSAILSDINANSKVGVRVVYEQESGDFTFTAREAGAKTKIRFGEGLADAVFWPAALNGGGGTFAQCYGIDWLKDGETEKVTFVLPDHESSFDISKEDSMQDVTDRLNASFQNFDWTASYNKYTGRIEAADKNGVPVDFGIKDSDGYPIEFDVDYAPDVNYTPGQDAIFTAVKVNGKPLPVSGNAVDVGASIASAVAAADHLQRKKVASVDEIDSAAEGADRFIYMVPKAGGKNGDKYDEYMVLDGAVESVGDWAVDLSGYQQKEEGKVLSSNDYTDADRVKLANIVLATDSEVDAMLNEVFGTAEA